MNNFFLGFRDIVVASELTRVMIYNAIMFIFFKTIKQRFFSILLDK